MSSVKSAVNAFPLVRVIVNTATFAWSSSKRSKASSRAGNQERSRFDFLPSCFPNSSAAVDLKCRRRTDKEARPQLFPTIARRGTRKETRYALHPRTVGLDLYPVDAGSVVVRSRLSFLLGKGPLRRTPAKCRGQKRDPLVRPEDRIDRRRRCDERILVGQFRQHAQALILGGIAETKEMLDEDMNTNPKAKKTSLLPLVHPGEILTEEFLKPLGVSEGKLSKAIAVPPRRINEIVHGTRAITADTAWRLGRFFRMTPQFWLNLQTGYDLRKLEREGGLPKIEPLAVAA